jgi:hypothetical protein
MAADRIRTTISLDPEVHAIFVTMAEASGTSVSRCMGDWLADTAEGAQFVASKMQEARRAPKTVMREMQAMSAGLHDLISSEVGQGRRKGAGGLPPAGGSRALEPLARLLGQEPPSSPTGVKSPGKGKSQGRKA